MICLFGQRLGSPTPRAKSGTVEGIELHRASGKEVMVFFKETIDSNCDLKQFEYLREFRSYLEKEGLLGSYKDANHLKDEISRRLNLFINSIVKTLLASLAQNPTKQEVSTATFSDEEIERLRLWCDSDSNSYSKINFEGGGCIYLLGGHQYEVTSGRDIA